MSPTKARIIQWFVILLILTGGTLGYFYYQSHAAINSKAATNNGLVGYWSFDEGSGTQAGDASGNGYTGTLTNGPTWVDGKLKKGISFDGTNDYVSMGNVLDFTTGDFSLSAWVKLPDQNTIGTIIAKRYNSSPFKQYSLGQGTTIAGGTSTASKKISFFAHNGGTLGAGSNTQSYYTTNDVADGKWHYVVGLRSSGTVKIYVDGVDMALTTVYSAASNPDVSNTANFTVGYDNGTAYLNSLIDDVRVYNRALTATEVTNLYTLGAAKVNATTNSNLTNGLVGLWSFDGKDISGTTAYDRSGQGNNGTLTNGPAPTLGKLGQALSLDGSNDYVSVADNSVQDIEVGQAKTISSWIKIGTGSATKRFLWKNYECTGWLFGLDGTEHIALTYQTGNNYCTGPNTYAITSSGVHTDSQWHHVVGVVDRPSLIMRLYVDGISVGSVAIDNTYFGGAGAGDMRIGTDWNNGLPFAGSIDDVRIYNRALSESEIRDLYQLGASDKVNSADAQTDPLEKGLTGYWKLDENTGTTAADASGNSNTGTLTNGPTWTPGKIGSGVNFDGTNDYINIPHQSYLNSYPLTTSVWFKTSAVSAGGMVSKYFVGSASGYQIFMHSSGSVCAWYFKDGSNNIYDGLACTLATNAYNDNSWHQATFVVDASGGKLYIDGGLKSSLAWTGVPGATTTSQPVSIGYYDNVAYFQGSLDEVRIYNRALSAEEVAKLYQTTAPDNPDTSLKGYWSFDGKDISGTTAYDRSGNGNNGTLTNGPTPTIGKLGQALSFDGTNDFIRVPNATSLQFANATSITLSAWVNPSQITGYRDFIVKGRDTDNFEANYAFRQDSTGKKLEFYYNESGNINWHLWTTNSDVFSTANQWYYVAVTYTFGTGSSMKAYVNGVSVAGSWSGGTGNVAPDVSTQDLLIGEIVTAENFSGILDDVRIYNRALTATEITSLYNQGR